MKRKPQTTKPRGQRGKLSPCRLLLREGFPRPEVEWPRLSPRSLRARRDELDSRIPRFRKSWSVVRGRAALVTLGKVMSRFACHHTPEAGWKPAVPVWSQPQPPWPGGLRGAASGLFVRLFTDRIQDLADDLGVKFATGMEREDHTNPGPKVDAMTSLAAHPKKAGAEKQFLRPGGIQARKPRHRRRPAKSTE